MVLVARSCVDAVVSLRALLLEGISLYRARVVPVNRRASRARNRLSVCGVLRSRLPSEI